MVVRKIAPQPRGCCINVFLVIDQKTLLISAELAINPNCLNRLCLKYHTKVITLQPTHAFMVENVAPFAPASLQCVEISFS
jgi:hypothetical protein